MMQALADPILGARRSSELISAGWGIGSAESLRALVVLAVPRRA